MATDVAAFISSIARRLEDLASEYYGVNGPELFSLCPR
jgi:hypothetical protein